MKNSNNITRVALKMQDPSAHRAALLIVKRDFRSGFARYAGNPIFDRAEAWSQTQTGYLKALESDRGSGEIVPYLLMKCRFALKDYIRRASAAALVNICDKCCQQFSWLKSSCYSCGSKAYSVVERNQRIDHAVVYEASEEIHMLAPALKQAILSVEPFDQPILNSVWHDSITTDTNPYYLFLHDYKRSQSYARHYGKVITDKIKSFITSYDRSNSTCTLLHS